MSRQSAKTKLMDLITGTDSSQLQPIRIIFDNEQTEETIIINPGDPPLIVFVDFHKKNEQISRSDLK